MKRERVNGEGAVNVDSIYSCLSENTCDAAASAAFFFAKRKIIKKNE